MLRVTLILALSVPSVEAAVERPRLIVLTDISSLTAGNAEPDDGQSMIRLLLYSNEFDLEGLIATARMRHGKDVRPDLIRQVVEAYGKVVPNLRRHDDRYPPAERLASTIKAGQPVAGRDALLSDSVGDTKDTEASAWIIRAVDRPDPRPVWVTIWGGSADLAQALWRVARDRKPEELQRFVVNLRVHSISEQDSTAVWIKKTFPDLFFITSVRAYRGMYRGGDITLSSSAWVERHITDHGPLGNLYPNYRGGDIWSASLGQVRGTKEGDSPSFLALVPNGLGDPEQPWLGSWGGRFTGEAKRYTDVTDDDVDVSDDPDPRMVTVYRWRPAFQADFQARLDWCVKPYAEANHPPVVQVRGDRRRPASPGDVVNLDARLTTDPDGNSVTFEWSVYPPLRVKGELVRIDDRTAAVAHLRVPAAPAGTTIPILLTVRDNGIPPLTRYGRTLIAVQGTFLP